MPNSQAPLETSSDSGALGVLRKKSPSLAPYVEPGAHTCGAMIARRSKLGARLASGGGVPPTGDRREILPIVGVARWPELSPEPAKFRDAGYWVDETCRRSRSPQTDSQPGSDPRLATAMALSAYGSLRRRRIDLEVALRRREVGNPAIASPCNSETWSRFVVVYAAFLARSRGPWCRSSDLSHRARSLHPRHSGAVGLVTCRATPEVRTILAMGSEILEVLGEPCAS